jgi:hypothetical protein
MTLLLTLDRIASKSIRLSNGTNTSQKAETIATNTA